MFLKPHQLYKVSGVGCTPRKFLLLFLLYDPCSLEERHNIFLCNAQWAFFSIRACPVEVQLCSVLLLITTNSRCLVITQCLPSSLLLSTPCTEIGTILIRSTLTASCFTIPKFVFCLAILCLSFDTI